jgi:hypothetical protein
MDCGDRDGSSSGRTPRANSRAGLQNETGMSIARSAAKNWG